MKIFNLSVIFVIATAYIAAQAPVTQVEGFLEVYHTEDNSSLYIGKKAGHKIENTYPVMSNTMIGSNAGALNTTGQSNSFVGSSAGFRNTIGSGNSFFGHISGHNNTGGFGNSFFGHWSGNSNTTGENNSFFW